MLSVGLQKHPEPLLGIESATYPSRRVFSNRFFRSQSRVYRIPQKMEKFHLNVFKSILFCTDYLLVNFFRWNGFCFSYVLVSVSLKTTLLHGKFVCNKIRKTQKQRSSKTTNPSFTFAVFYVNSDIKGSLSF